MKQPMKQPLKQRPHRVRPAALLPLRLYRLDGAQLHCSREDGSALWQIDLARVTRAEWRSAKAGQSLTRVLRLTTPDAWHDIRQHLARRAYIGGPDDMAFRAAAAATLRALQTAQPALRVETGASDVQALALFAIGLASLGAALALPVWTVLRGDGWGALLEWAMPAILALFLGLSLVRGYGPGRARLWQAPTDIATTLETVD